MQDNEYQRGARRALQIMCDQLDLKRDGGKPYKNGYDVTELTLAHIIATNDECSCVVQRYSNVIDLQPCPDWENASYRRAWYCEWYGLTLEELAAMERAELEKAHMTDRERRKQRVAQLKAELEAELKDYGVVIELPRL